jgi:hypothetical protein
VDDILAKARKALGGDTKLAGLKSLTATGTIRRMPAPRMRIMVMVAGAANRKSLPPTPKSISCCPTIT